MENVSLGRRFISTIIDKILIAIFFVIASYVFCTGAPGAEFAYFISQLGITYKNIESEKTIHERNVEVNEWLKENGISYRVSDDQDFGFYKTKKDVYDKYVWLFFSVNLIYYLLCELIFKASLGKKALKCRIRKVDGNQIDYRDAFIRTGILAILLLLAIVIQMTMNINSYVTSILFFAILDFTVFTKQCSLVDKYSYTLVAKFS